MNINSADSASGIRSLRPKYSELTMEALSSTLEIVANDLTEEMLFLCMPTMI